MGILRRAFERGKALPKKLERALKIQAGLALPDGQITDIDAYHINQRDEGIDLQGVSGALMATSNMQMQTFVTQASENTEGFDGYNGDLTGDVAATLGVNCGMSTGRNGVIAFAANQRDEVRDLHDVAGALNAQPGIKQQTFVAGFSAGAGASAGSIGYHESVAPTLKAGASGNCMPSVLCINDQGGQVMEISENMTGTLRAQEHGHQPLVYAQLSVWRGRAVTAEERSNAVKIYSMVMGSAGSGTYNGAYEPGGNAPMELEASLFTDPATKNSADLAIYAASAWNSGWGYVWGTFGQVLTPELLQYKISQYPEGVGDEADFIRSHWLNRRTTDCVGLIKGYGWLNTVTMEIQYGSNGMPDVGADGMYYNAGHKGSIETMPNTPGLAVWKSGHIGVYIGNGEVIEAMDTRYGVVKTKLQGRGWTHWLEVPGIKYD